MNDWMEYWPVALLATQGVVGWAMWSIRSTLVTKSEYFDSQRASGERVGDLERKLARAEERLESMPSKDDLAGLTKNMQDVCGNIQALTAEIRGVKNTFDVKIDGIENSILSLKETFDAKIQGIASSFAAFKTSHQLLLDHHIGKGKKK